MSGLNQKLVTPFPTAPTGSAGRTWYRLRATTAAGNLDQVELGSAKALAALFQSYGGVPIACYPDGGIVIAESFSGSVTFGAGEPNETTLTSAGDADGFVARYNPDGTLAWARSLGGAGWDVVTGLSVFPDDSMVVTGGFDGTATLGVGDPHETTLSFTGDGHIFVARYNPDGTLAWAKGVATGGWDGSYTAAIPDGSTVLTGTIGAYAASSGGGGGSATFGTGEPNETTLVSAGSTDVFVARYNPDGTLAWAKRAGGDGHDYPNVLAHYDPANYRYLEIDYEP